MSINDENLASESRAAVAYMALQEVLDANRQEVEEVLSERATQDRQWGGPAHDDEHTPDEWLAYIDRRVRELYGLTIPDDLTDWNAEPDFRRLLKEVAALCIAAMASRRRISERESGGDNRPVFGTLIEEGVPDA